MAANGMRARRMLELRVIDALRAWADPVAPTVRSLAKAVNHPHMLLADVVRGMQYGGVLHLNSLKLTANYLVANDGAAIESEAATAGETAPVSVPVVEDAAPVRADVRPSPIASDSGVSGGGGAVGEESCAMPTSPTAECAEAEPVAVLGLMPSARVKQVYDHIRDVAERGAPCPKNRELAVAAGCMESAIPTVLVWLRDNGWLVLEKGRALKERRFLVPATGQRTGWPAPDERIGTGACPTGALEAKAAEEAEIAARVLQVEWERGLKIADVVKAEAIDAGKRRRMASTTGGGTVAGSKLTVRRDEHSGSELSIGGRLQLAGMSDGPGSAAALLRGQWAGDLDLLGRIAALHGERPVPMLVRLIREEAARHDLRRAVAHELPGGGAWWVGGGSRDGGVDASFEDEGVRFRG